MLFRFSLYGFLKNQAYFEPFLILSFTERGLSFADIGLAIGIREFVANLLQVPTGALADVYGRRRCLIFSFLVYIVSFLLLAFGNSYWQVLLGISFFGSGDAFRGGTHKAMILDWLRSQGRESERTKVYGYTRSWSKFGSALSVVIGAALVFLTADYQVVFWAVVVPYVLNLINVATYPAWLDGVPKNSGSLAAVARQLWRVTVASFHRPELRRLISESMSYGGLYDAVKDYLQPLLKLTALAIPLALGLPDVQRTAVLVGAVYFVLHLLSGVASRGSHRFVERLGSGDEERAAVRLWQLTAAAYALLLLCLFLHFNTGIIVLFVLLACGQNLWRPLLISRFDAHSDPADGATLLSIESQASSLATLALAPLLGWCVDLVNAGLPTAQEREFWPVALAGLLPALAMLLTAPRQQKASETWEGEAPAEPLQD